MSAPESTFSISAALLVLGGSLSAPIAAAAYLLWRGPAEPTTVMVLLAVGVLVGIAAATLFRQIAALLYREQHLEMKRSLAELRSTRDALIESTRLASVGEMAGQTAHEVLNPMTSARGRIHRLMDSQALDYDHALDVLRTVFSAWRKPLAAGGFEKFVEELSAPDPNGRTMLENDVAALSAVEEALNHVRDELNLGHSFVLKELDRVTVIVDRMRRLTRSNAECHPVPVDEVIEETSSIIEDTALKRNILVKTDVQSRDRVFGDRQELIQILNNVARNGIQAIVERHHGHGGILVLDTERHGDHVHIRVTDDGTGISIDHIDRVFDSGFTTRREEDGTGLGLGIARRLARTMGGDLSVESTAPGEGTTFLLELPIIEPDGPHAAQ